MSDEMTISGDPDGIPPSREALQQISETVYDALARPGEEGVAVVAFLIVEGPDGWKVRAHVQPADGSILTEDLFHFLQHEMDGALG